MGKRPTTELPAEDPERTPEWGERRRLPERLSRLRQKLGHKAKQEPDFRFYALYDRIYWPDALRAAWAQVRSNKGAPGVDGVSIHQIENSEGGVDRFLELIQEDLRATTYKPRAVRRVYIPKADGKLRPSGVARGEDAFGRPPLLDRSMGPSAVADPVDGYARRSPPA